MNATEAAPRGQEQRLSLLTQTQGFLEKTHLPLTKLAKGQGAERRLGCVEVLRIPSSEI